MQGFYRFLLGLGPAQLQQADFSYQTPDAGRNPAYGAYYDNLLGAQQDLRDRYRSAYLSFGVPPGPQMAFQPDVPIDMSQINWYGPGEQQPWPEANYRAWQHVFSGLGHPDLLPADPPWMWGR